MSDANNAKTASVAIQCFMRRNTVSFALHTAIRNDMKSRFVELVNMPACYATLPRMKSGVSKEDAMLARRKAERAWRRLCNKYLPLRPKRSIWWFSRRRSQRDLAQGWKLHVSATVQSACAIFRLVAPYLSRRNIALKAVKVGVRSRKS
jgi:hypothetical protein